MPEPLAAKPEKFWLTHLEPSERSTLIGTFAGWMLNGMDVMVYSFVLPELIVLWHLTKSQAGLLGTSALVPLECPIICALDELV